MKTKFDYPRHRKWKITFTLVNASSCLRQEHVTIAQDMSWADAMDVASQTLFETLGPRPASEIVTSVFIQRISTAAENTPL
jgi:hypothetical protein